MNARVSPGFRFNRDLASSGTVAWNLDVSLLAPIIFGILNFKNNKNGKIYKYSVCYFLIGKKTKKGMKDMKLLVDECCNGLANRLKDIGWEVKTVKEVLDRPAGEVSVSDDRILAHAKENKLIIITKDKGLHRDCIAQKVPCINPSMLYDEARIVDRKLQEIMMWKEYMT